MATNTNDPNMRGQKLPPGAANQLGQMPRPGASSPGTAMVPAGPRMVNPDPGGRAPRMVGGAANPVPPAGPPAAGLPPYRTGAAPGQPQFKQTPTPTNPTFRAPPAAPTSAASLGAAPAPAAAAGAPPAATPGRLAAAGQKLGRAGTVAGVLLEGANVATVAQDPNATGLDVAEQAARGTSRLATGYLGAKGGAALGALAGPGAPIASPVLATLGGIGGFVGGPRLIDAGNSMGETPNSKKGEAIARGVAPSLTGLPGGAALAQFAPQIGSYLGALTDAPDTSPVARAPGFGAPAAAPPVAAAPVAEAAGPSSAEVLGNFNGRPITREQANDLAGQLPTVPGAPESARALAAPIEARGAPVIGSTTTRDMRTTRNIIDQTLKDLGPLNMRSKRALAGQLLGTRAQLAAGTAGLASQQAIEQGRLDAGANSDALEAQKAQAAAQQPSGSPIVGEDGGLYTLQGNTLAPITGADGKPARAPTNDTEAQKLYADLIKQLLPPGSTPEEVAAANQSLAQIPGLDRIALGVGKGETYVGQSPDGKRVYQDEKGNRFTY
ncbi:MAG: hypothetical protein AB7V08_13795 [Elusimicrobiales bacterium]